MKSSPSQAEAPFPKLRKRSSYAFSSRKSFIYTMLRWAGQPFWDTSLDGKIPVCTHFEYISLLMGNFQMPFPGGLDDRLQVGIAEFPAQRLLSLFFRGQKNRHISQPSWLDIVSYFAAGN